MLLIVPTEWISSTQHYYWYFCMWYFWHCCCYNYCCSCYDYY